MRLHNKIRIKNKIKGKSNCKVNSPTLAAQKARVEGWGTRLHV
jgi:hypothetical protein